MTSQTITIPAAQLKALLTKAIPFADPTVFIPVFNAVLIERDGEWTTASATDRYRAGIARQSTPGQDGKFRALLSLNDCKAVLRLFPKERRGEAERILTLTITDAYLHVEQKSTFPHVEATFETVVGDFPKSLQTTVRKAFAGAGDEVKGRVTQLRSDYLSDLKHLGQSVRIHPAGERSPVLITATDFVGVIMPMHTPDDEHGFEDWSALLPPIAEDKAA